MNTFARSDTRSEKIAIIVNRRARLGDFRKYQAWARAYDRAVVNELLAVARLLKAEEAAQ